MNDDPERMAAKIKELKQEIHGLREAMSSKGIRYRSKWSLFGCPLLSIAFGSAPEKNEARGHALGIIAIGDFATGCLAIGGLARGIFALGGGAIGLVALGGGAIGFLALGGWSRRILRPRRRRRRRSCLRCSVSNSRSRSFFRKFHPRHI